VEIMRDPVRIAFALLSPMLLMFAFGYGISFDVEHLRFAVFDQSRSLESREFLESFEGSRFWSRQPDIAAPDQIQTRLRSGELKFAIEIPPLFGSDLLRERRPEIAIWINGDMPNRAETTRTYLGGLTLDYWPNSLYVTPATRPPCPALLPATHLRCRSISKRASATISP
jgi:ribosome-dependent ATPase